jgi:hypothetical protein
LEKHVFPGHVQHFAGERCAARLQADSMQDHSQKAEKRKVEKWKGVFVNFEKSKNILFDFSLFDCLNFWRMPFQLNMLS